MTDRTDANLRTASPSNKFSSTKGAANFRTEEIRGASHWFSIGCQLQ